MSKKEDQGPVSVSANANLPKWMSLRRYRTSDDEPGVLVTHCPPERLWYIAAQIGALVIFIPGMAISLYLLVKVYRQQKR